MLTIARALASKPLTSSCWMNRQRACRRRWLQTIRDGILESRARGVSILLVEQNLALALALAEVFFVVSRGAVVHQASRDQILSNPNLVTKHLGVSTIKGTSKIN